MRFQRQLNHIKDHASFLMSGTAIIGVVSTSYLTYKAALSATDKILINYQETGEELDRKEKFKLVWKDYIPPVASGVVTIGCIIGNTKLSNRKTAAAQAAFVLSERVFSEYKAAVAEEVGEKTATKIHDKVVSERIQNNPPPEAILAVAGPGNVLCCENMTGRYFTSDIETLRKQVNRLNEELLKHDRLSLSDWYELIGLERTSMSDDYGWQSDRLMELIFTTTLATNGQPCLVFDYNYHRPLYYN